MEKVSLIDIGSNTIRLVIYRLDGGGAREVFNHREFAGLIEYLQDGSLSDPGIDTLVNCLKEMRDLIDLVGSDRVDVFATASLRGISNLDTVRLLVKQETDFDIQVLTAVEETYYDQVGLKRSGLAQEGVGLDLGGGSCQIFTFCEAGICDSVSLPIGSLRMYQQFVRGVVPSKEEGKLIKSYVKDQLESHRELEDAGFSCVYAMGGSARAAAKLHRALTGGSQKIDAYELTAEDLKEMTDTIREMGIGGVRLLGHVLPERLYTLLPGMITLRAVTRFLGAGKIVVVKNSVREGYLWSKILGKSDTSIES